MGRWTEPILCFFCFLYGLRCLSMTFNDDTSRIHCDFDLENIEAILPELPEKCIEIYRLKDTDPDMFERYRNEAKEFAKFNKKLEEHELAQANIDGEEALSQQAEYPMDKQLRKDIYGKIDMANCSQKAPTTNQTSAKQTIKDYLNCIIEKRTQMTQMVPSV